VRSAPGRLNAHQATAAARRNPPPGGSFAAAPITWYHIHVIKLSSALILFLALAGSLACNKKSPSSEPIAAEGERAAPESRVVPQPARPERGDEYASERARMVTEQIAAREIRDPRVLAAMRAVPRHEFVPEALRGRAYADRPLPIGEGQTISQPYIVALMTELASVAPGARVLEIGTGSGYQAAVLAELAGQVYTIEIVEPLAEQAREVLERLGYENIQFRVGDGYRGWPEATPFDAILVTAAPPRVPEPLKEQLAVGGRIVIPVGEHYQSLRVITRTASGFEERDVASVRFVPMTGEAQE
jgi:protein-L-isoaspartate(D-aspartate) O-methyltransferase